MTTLIDRVVGVSGVYSYTCKLGIFLVMPLTLPMLIFEKKIWRAVENLSNFGYHIIFLCNTPFLSNFSRALSRDIFLKIGMDNVRDITKYVPNLQVYEHTHATPTTLSIKVVIVALY